MSNLGEVFPNAPVPLLVGIRKCGFRHRLAQSEVMERGGPRVEVGCDVPEPFALGQLCEYHASRVAGGIQNGGHGIGHRSVRPSGKASCESRGRGFGRE